MRDATRLLVTLLVAVGLALPAGAAAAVTGGQSAVGATDAATQQSGNSTVNVTAGAQLSTVLAVTESEVDAKVNETAFEIEYESADEEARAEAIAERAEALRERARTISEDYREATEAYREGELTRDQYAQRLATLNARANSVVNGYDRLQERAGAVSALELEAVGYNGSAVRGTVRSLDNVSGSGTDALLQRFTGETRGEVEVETANGLSVSVEREDGERSREFERPRDRDRSLTVDQSDALATARESLSEANGSWTLQSAAVDRGNGAYRFSFTLDASGSTGAATVAVDGSSGEVFSLEEEIERTDDEDEANEAEPEDEEEEDDGEERELALLVTSGDVGANETITVRALADGEPATDVTVLLNGEPVGTTDANGTLDVTLPAGGEVELTAGDEGELEFDLGGEERSEAVRMLATSASLDDGTVTVTVDYDGSPVRNATVYANDEAVGTTDAGGATSFALADDTEELELELVKGEFEAELEYRVDNGTLTLVESEHEGDGDHVGEEADDDGTEDEETEADDDGTEDEETETDDDEMEGEETEDGEEAEDEETETDDDGVEDEETETDDDGVEDDDDTDDEESDDDRTTETED